MKILLVSLCFFKVPPEKGGGVDNHTFNLANALAELAHEVHYVADVNNGTAFHENVVLHPTKGPPLPLRTNFLGWVRNHFIANLFAFKSALSALVHDSFDFDVIHCHGNLLSMLTTFFKKEAPLVYTVHNPTPWMCYYDSAFERLIRVSACKAVEEPAWRRANHIIAPSKTIKNEIRRRGIPAKKITVIHNGVDASIFDPNASSSDSMEEKYGVKSPYCLFVGQLMRRKGVIYLLRALVDVDVNCVIVGDGPERSSLMLAAKNLGISNRVTFTGAIPLEDLRELYAGASFFVFPSLADVGVTLTILEALSSGLPVIATDIPGTGEVVIDGYNGFLIPPRQGVEALRSKIQLLVENTELCKRMRMKARRTVERKFSWRSVAEKTITVYESAMES